MVLGGVGWDRKEFSESNLHVCGKNDTKIVVYNVKRCTENGREKNSCTIGFSTKPYDTNYLRSSEDRFLIVLVSSRLERLNLIVFLLG